MQHVASDSGRKPRLLARPPSGLPCRQPLAALLALAVLVHAGLLARAADAPARHEFSLDAGWRTAAAGGPELAVAAAFEQPGFDDRNWQLVDVPHNWDDYGGLHRVVHGNRHGTAWYRRSFEVAASERGRRVLLFFEGVGSYAMVWVNGKPAGQHAGGRTTFTLDVTDLVAFGGANLLAVRADHPAGIEDLPWVCGGCSPVSGFSEGSQPMGIFRPVHLITAAPLRITPFGVHVWNDASATRAAAVVHLETELRNDGAASRTCVLETRIRDRDGRIVADLRADQSIAPGAMATIRQDTPELHDVRLWSLRDPALYTVESRVLAGRDLIDEVETPFGIRVIHWPAAGDADGRFYLNGEPVFINGTCEYEHVLGASHAFGAEQIRTRVRQVEAAGFNAFRDAHQPHNLRYQDYWDHDGLLWWPQFCAHIWFDTPAFRENFKRLLRDWVRERRNSPSLVLWGLANESTLPEGFARECTTIIRDLDPTASSQRLVTTCNGGKGTDWNVLQNWSGTYGGDPLKYADELRRERLVGEYGAWRSLGLHTEDGYVKDGPHSEERFAALMETKIRLGESVRDQVAGQFHWLIATHENPGRRVGTGPGNKPSTHDEQGADGWASLDRIGPANNKGLLTLWGEPTDAFYLYRANYAPVATDPMVVIVSHTWPDRWSGPGRKDGIVIYSNCDEVELFNDFRAASLGTRKREGRGTHFQWDGADVTSNVLYAEGRVGGRVVARDTVVLANLPEAPHRAQLNGTDARLLAPEPRLNYLYRVNCGGPDVTDSHGNHWHADRDFAPGANWGSTSWASEYPDVPPRLGSERETSDPIRGANLTDEKLFQTFRYGRAKLHYRFAVPNGDYRVELYFTEPWYGRGGGNCTGWRLFDVAVNGSTVLREVDLWREAGYAHAVKKIVTATARDGWLEISFPRVASYEAVISGIAIATADSGAKVPAEHVVAPAVAPQTSVSVAAPVPRGGFAGEVYPARAAQLSRATFVANRAVLAQPGASLGWAISSGLGGSHEVQLRYVNLSGRAIGVELSITSADGTVVDQKRWSVAPTAAGAFGQSGPESGMSFNAGSYRATLTLLDAGRIEVESLTVK
jgi:beta-galactosidase